MLFNSPEFLLFLPIDFGLYWFVVQRNRKVQKYSGWYNVLPQMTKGLSMEVDAVSSVDPKKSFPHRLLQWRNYDLDFISPLVSEVSYEPTSEP